MSETMSGVPELNPSMRTPWLQYPMLGRLSQESRSMAVVWCQFLFSITFLLFGLFASFRHKEMVCGVFMIALSMMFVCLFIAAWLGTRFRSVPLLYMHASQCAFVSMLLVLAVALSLLLISPREVTFPPLRSSIASLQTTAVCGVALLVSFGASSLVRAREILKTQRQMPRDTVRAIVRRMKNVVSAP